MNSSKKLATLLAAMLLSAFAAPLGWAQSAGDDGDCDDIVAQRASDNLYGENSALLCNRNLGTNHTLIYQTGVIRDIVGRRLLANPFLDVPVPAGLAYDSEAEAGKALAGDGTIRIIPAADAVAAAPVNKWNMWIDGKRSWIDPGDIPAPTDGDLTNLSLGLDYKLTDRILLGLLGSYEHTDLDTTGLVDSATKTDGYGAGLYLGITMTDNIVFSGMVTATNLDTDSLFFGADADIDSDRIQASAGLTGYWYFGTTRLSPSITLAWSKEWQNEFTDSLGFFSPDQTLQNTVLTVGNQLGHTFAAGGTSIEPWVGVQFDWTFVNEVKTEGFPEYSFGDSYDLRVQTGVIWNLATNAQLSLTGEISGLLMPDNDIYSGQANFAFQF
jgi:hypothetical protein